VADAPATSASKSSTKIVWREWPACRALSSMKIDRFSASSQTASVSDATSDGSRPKRRTYQSLAAT
jgi:hypothetical protein